MKRKENRLLDISRIVMLTLLLFGGMSGIAYAQNPSEAGVSAVAAGKNITLNVNTATSLTSVPIIVTVNMTNASANSNLFNVNITGAPAVNLNGSGADNITIALVNTTNISFTVNSSSPTEFFSLVISNPKNQSENATLTGFSFINSTAISVSNTTVTYNNGSIPTSIPTSVYYFFNGRSINITVQTIAKMDNVTADYSNVSGGTGYNITGENQSGVWYYNITNVSAISAPATNPSYISVNLTINGIPITVAQPFVALMNFNPKVLDSSLKGATTNWTTIPDFTNVSSLTFEKFSGGNALGKIVFTSPIDLSNTTTALALSNIGTNLKMVQNNMSLNTAQNALAAMNVSANLTMYNLSLSSLPAIFSKGQPIVTSGDTSGGSVSGLAYNNVTRSLTFSVGHWSDYTIFGLENVSVFALPDGTSKFTMRLSGMPNMNVTINSSRTQDKINGNVVPQYILTGSSGIVTFNVTTTVGSYANITATNGSTTVNNTNVFFYHESLTNQSALSSSTDIEVNATYYLNLTNAGTATDNYTLVIDNGSASVAMLNIPLNLTLNASESREFSLNVTNLSQGMVYVNVSAKSQAYPDEITYVNTTTNVISSNPYEPIIYLGNVTLNGILKIANITVLDPDGKEVVNAISNYNGVIGQYLVEVPQDNPNTQPDEGIIPGEKITLQVNKVTVYSGIAGDSNHTNKLDLSLYNGTLAGSVIKLGTNIGIIGARVNITNATFGSTIVTTDTSGTYRASLYPGIYNISVSKTGFSNDITTATITSNTPTSSVISLSPNTITITADRTVGTADAGQNVSFNLAVVNTGDNSTFSVISDKDASTIVTSTTNPSPLLLNAVTPTGYVVVEVNNSNFGGWPVTITISNSSQSKSASVTLNAIMRNSSANYTSINSTIDPNSTVTGATLVNTTAGANVTVSGNSTLIMDTTVTGENAVITNGTVIKGTYTDSYIDNSTIGNATVDSSNLTASTISDNAYITNSTLTGANVANSTLDYVTVTGFNTITMTGGSTITNTVGLSNIILSGVTITGDTGYGYEGKISAGTGWVNYLAINFTKIYEAVRISQLVIEQSGDVNVSSNTSTAINDTSIGKSMNFSMTVNLSRPMVINISETFINPDGAGFSSGTKLGNFLVIQSNDTNSMNVRNHTLRLYFDTDPATFTGGVAINYYNTTTSAWEALPTTASGNEGGRWYIEAVPNHFSTFALLGTTTSDSSGTTTTSNGGGGSSGGGGGGGKSAESTSNIEVIEKYDLQISKDALTSYRFTHEKNPVMFVNITGNTSIGIITASIEVLIGTSTIVKLPPEGLVYKNANIWVGNKGFATSRNIKEALITFKVLNSWMNDNSVLGSSILLKKWDGSGWIELETKALSKDDTYSYFEGKTTSFSPFAIVAKVSAVQPIVTENQPAVTPMPVATGTPVKPPVKESGISTWLIGLIILVIIAIAGYFLVMRKKE